MSLLLGLALFSNMIPGEWLDFDVLYEAPLGGFERESVIVLTNDSSFGGFWGDIMGYMHDKPVAPEVDFDSSFVVGVFLGKRPSLGYGLEVSAILLQATPAGPWPPLQTDKELLVYANEKCPQGMAAQMISSPFVLLRVSRSVYFADISDVNPRLVLARCHEN